MEAVILAGGRSMNTSSAGSAVYVATQQATAPDAPITPNWGKPRKLVTVSEA